MSNKRKRSQIDVRLSCLHAVYTTHAYRLALMHRTTQLQVWYGQKESSDLQCNQLSAPVVVQTLSLSNLCKVVKKAKAFEAGKLARKLKKSR